MTTTTTTPSKHITTTTTTTVAVVTPESYHDPVKESRTRTTITTTTCSSIATSLSPRNLLRQRGQQHQPEKNGAAPTLSLMTAQDWYDQGERVWYDPIEKKIVHAPTEAAFGEVHVVNEDTPPSAAVVVCEEDGDDDDDSSPPPTSPMAVKRNLLQVFCRAVLPNKKQETTTAESNHQDTTTSCSSSEQNQRWMTFLPGDPEGSYGFHQVEDAISCGLAEEGARTRCNTDQTEMSSDESVVAAAPPPPPCFVDADAAGFQTRLCESELETTDQNHPEQKRQQQQPSSSSTTADNTCVSSVARLYLDYVGQGDSDCDTRLSSSSSSPDQHETVSNSIPLATTATAAPSPRNSSSFSLTQQRADLVEAHWVARGIRRTVVVSVGESSSLVVMELLQRQRTRLAAGTPFPKVLHVLAVNGRYVAKSRHVSQLPTVTQLLRSERLGASLAAKAGRSDFYLSQCLQPHLKGCRSSPSGNSVRQQVLQVVRRHEGASSLLLDMAHIVDDHLQDKHRYRWCLPRIHKIFGMNQGITVQLATTNRQAQRHVQLVQQQLEEYDMKDCPGIRYEEFHHYKGSCSSTSFLLDSTTQQLKPFLQAVQRLANEEIPLSDNSVHHLNLSSRNHHESWGVMNHERFATTTDEDDNNNINNNNDDDLSWVGSANGGGADLLEGGGGSYYYVDDDNEMHRSQDTRLQTEIVFDTNFMDNDDFEVF